MAMNILPLLLCGLVTTTACKKSTCEKYADMEVTCGGIPANEADMTRAMAQGMCSEDPPAGAEEFSKQIRREASCAANTTDCAVYKACTDKMKAERK